MKICAKCGHENPDHVAACKICGGMLPENPFATQQQGDATGGVIPYKNPHALIAYYLGIASGLPIIGLPFGVAAFALGIMGLRARNRNPIIKGSIHAGIGIGCGCVFSILWTIAIVGIIAAVLQA